MKTKILFVCLGNICRSPAADGIMKALTESQGVDHLFDIDSAGIGSWHVGQLPDHRMREHGARYGVLPTICAGTPARRPSRTPTTAVPVISSSPST